MYVCTTMNWTIFISHLLKEFRLSSYQLQKQFNINSAIISNLRNGRTKSPNEETIRQLEMALGIKIDDSDPENIRYTKIDADDLSLEASSQVAEKRRWPMVLGFVPASTNGSVSTYYEESIEEKPLDYSPDDNFWLRVDLRNGDSMLPLISPGDYVLVSRIEKPKHGDMVFVLFLDEPTARGAIKIMIGTENDPATVAFYSYNSQHAPIIKKRESCRIYKVKLIEKK